MSRLDEFMNTLSKLITLTNLYNYGINLDYKSIKEILNDYKNICQENKNNNKQQVK